MLKIICENVCSSTSIFEHPAEIFVQIIACTRDFRLLPTEIQKLLAHNKYFSAQSMVECRLEIQIVYKSNFITECVGLTAFLQVLLWIRSQALAAVILCGLYCVILMSVH